jgi:hypothetical protein
MGYSARYWLCVGTLFPKCPWRVKGAEDGVRTAVCAAAGARSAVQRCASWMRGRVGGAAARGAVAAPWRHPDGAAAALWRPCSGNVLAIAGALREGTVLEALVCLDVTGVLVARLLSGAAAAHVLREMQKKTVLPSLHVPTPSLSCQLTVPACSYSVVPPPPPPSAAMRAAVRAAVRAATSAATDSFWRARQLPVWSSAFL